MTHSRIVHGVCGTPLTCMQFGTGAPVHNLTIVGEPGAIWRMNKQVHLLSPRLSSRRRCVHVWRARYSSHWSVQDYQGHSCDKSSPASTNKTCYAISEWRHGLSLWWGIDISVSGLLIANSGGDGILLGAMEGGGGDRSNAVGLTQRVTISNVTSDGNHRQGLSLINCVTCLIEDCIFSNTNGTKPMAGVDIVSRAKPQTL